MTVVRTAQPADFDCIADIAVEGDSADADGRYLSFIAQNGRLLVAVREGSVIGFGGMVPVDGAAMVTDLFVAADCRGGGAGTLLVDQLLRDWPQRLTCSSRHPAAQRAYRRAGMEPRWRLLYLVGPATGGGPLLRPAAWAHDRPELAAHFAASGSLIASDVVVTTTAEGATVERLQHPDAIRRMTEVLASLPAGVPVLAHVPEPHPLAHWLLAQGFRIVDHDVFLATEGVELRDDCSCVHAGLL